MSEETNTNAVVELTAEVVSAYVSKNPVPAAELPGLITQIHQSLSNLTNGEASALEAAPTPAVNPKRSIQNDYLICLEDGKKFKSLKRHLMTHYGLTPEQYRQKWNLPHDYPMVCPSYAAARSELAKKMGLGRKAKEAAPAKRTRKRAA